MSNFQPPPTWALPIMKDDRTGESIFNPVWLRWFLDLSSGLNDSGTASIINVIDASGGTLLYPLLAASQTGNIAVLTDGGLSYNASTNTLSATGFAGALSGAVNKVTLTAPAIGATLTITDGKTLAATHTITLSGTDSTVMTFPGTSASIARIDTGQTFVGAQAFSTSAKVTGSGGVGYAAGAGGVVTQLTSRTTDVTLDKAAGAITLFSAAGSPTPASFTVTNSTVAADDVPVLAVKSGTNTYVALVSAVAAGSFQITFWATTGTATDSPVINFTLIKGAVS